MLVDPKPPENEKDEGGHRDLVELGGVYTNHLAEALDEGRIDLNTEVALDPLSTQRSSLPQFCTRAPRWPLQSYS